MATLVPSDFDLGLLVEAEQRVCRSLLTGLDDSWLVIPHVPITVEHTDAEIDIVLVSAAVGVVLVEVKGGVVEIVSGRWMQNGKPMAKSPVEQVMRAKHCLVGRMKSAKIDVRGLFMVHVVALPDVYDVPSTGVTPEAPAEIVFGARELDVPEEAIRHLLREHPPVAPDRLRQFVRALRPDVTLGAGQGDVLQAATRRLDAEAALHVATASRLDVNRRVLVTGGAGTGKTLVATTWAAQAVRRGERVLLVCFNKPIGATLQRSIGQRVDDVAVSTGIGPVMAGTYHDIAVRLLEPHGFAIAPDSNSDYWRTVPTAALDFHAEKVGTPFDTVIIDEGQDFHPEWVASLERLLDPAGPQRLLMTADPAQAIYVPDWTPPAGALEVPLVYNLRNCRAIAKLVERLGGPPPLPGAPLGDAVRFVKAGGPNEVRRRVRDEVRTLVDEFHVPYGQIAVLVTTTRLRDQLIDADTDGLPLARWERRSEDTVMCETVHRAKGLERTAVVFVDIAPEPDRRLLYVGASRAVSALRLVGSDGLAAYAG